jgi:alcohol dehydrogenase (cytochrome c)
VTKVHSVAVRLSAAGLAVFVAGADAARAQALFKDETFAEAAAARGQAAFAQNCAACHGADLSAGPFGPALKGVAFEAHWKGQPIQTVQAFIQARMPPAAPGSLGSEAVNDIAAYILKANGAAAGKPDTSATAAAPPREAANSGRPPPTVPSDARAKAVLAARKARLDALIPVTAAMLQTPPDSDWLIWRRTYQSQGFSQLRQIDRANVATLRPAWSWNLPPSQNEMTPLVHDGVMFVQSGNAVQALDAATGEQLWQYIRPLPAALAGGRASRAKSLAIYGNKLLVPTADKHLIALDMRSGALIWDHDVVGDSALQLNGGPIVARGKVIIGASLNVTRSPGGCFIVALDVETGREVWRFDTIARPGQPGGDSWNGAPVEERYGGGVWTSGSYDPARNLLFFGVGNTYDVGTLVLPHAKKGESNDGLYTASTLAIDPDTGKLVWFYQHMNRDVWDQDWAFEQTLTTLPIDGKPRDVVVTAGKLGIFDVMDRATGKYLFSKDLGLQNLVTAIDPKTGRKTTNPALEPESGKTKIVCPSTTGARAWPATSLDPQTHVVYVPMTESCMQYTFTARSPAEVAAGGVDIRYPNQARPDSDGNFGRIQAVNLDTRQVVWTHRQRAPTASSVLATAGGLVFAGSVDRRFSAYDAATGKTLWEIPLNASPSSSPVTYTVAGVQYVAVVTGGGGAYDSDGQALVAEVATPAAGVTVMVYRLAK